MKELATLNSGLSILEVTVDELREQDLNARTMTREASTQLSDNIKKRGALETLPFVAKTDKGLEIISGHHRVRAARDAGVTTIHVLADTTGLSRDAIVSKQLSHNSINGKDDPELVKRLFDEILNAELKIDAFINPADLAIPSLDDIKIPELNAGINWHHISILFLARQMDKFEEVIKTLSDEERVFVADLEHWEKFKAAINGVRKEFNIKSIGFALAKMCELAELGMRHDVLAKTRMKAKEAIAASPVSSAKPPVLAGGFNVKDEPVESNDSLIQPGMMGPPPEDKTKPATTEARVRE